MDGSAISEQQQIVRIDQKWLSWQIRAQGKGQMDSSSRNAVSFDRSDSWQMAGISECCQIWQLTDEPVKILDSDQKIGRWEWFVMICNIKVIK